MSRARALWTSALLGVCGCAAPSFQAQFVKPASPTERVVLAEITHAKPRDERPVAVGVTTEPTRLCAWDINAGLLWERPVHAVSAPLVAADAVVMQEANGIVVRDLTSGEVRVVIDDDGGHLIGADGEGKSIVIAIGYDGAAPRAAVALVEGEKLRWKQPLYLPVGVPALISGYVLVPWATQRLSVLSVRDGRELARWDFQHAVLGYAEVDRGHVFIGQHGFFPLDQATLERAGEIKSAYAPLPRGLPGQPPLLRDGYAPVPEPGNAANLLKLEWRVATDDKGALHAENDLLALRFFRILFAFDAGSDRVRFVSTFEHDLVGAAMQPHGLFVAERNGALHFLDDKGEPRFARDLGRKLQVLTIRPGEWIPTWTADDATSPPESLRAQLFTAAALHDDRLTVARAFAVDQLMKIDDEAVTSNLIALCGDKKTPAELRNTACTNLGLRKDGADDVLRALGTHASFLEDEDNPPPVGALAKAAAQMQLQPAAALLTAQLDDPNTSARDLVPVLNAIEQLNHRPAVPALERFVRLHHAEPADSELEPALYAALHALGSLRVRSVRATLSDVADDGLTPDDVRGKAREALTMLDAPPAPPPEKKPEPKIEAAPEPVAAIEDPRPYELDNALVRDALRPVGKELSRCLPSDPSHPRSARISMVVQGEGRVEGVFVIPASLQSCIEPLVRKVQFPATRSGRQRVNHVVFGPNAEPAASKPTKRPTNASVTKRVAVKQNTAGDVVR